MNEGERQVSTLLSGIRRDHTARYEWASKNIPKDSVVLDLACGIGYGSKILAEAGCRVLGLDIDKEAIEYANEHWKHENNMFAVADMTRIDDKIDDFDIVILFEAIEHIENPVELLKALRLSTSNLLCSVPNENVLPWQQPDGKTTRFHYRHYTKDEFEQLLNDAGWQVDGWYGQEGVYSEVEENVEGRTLIAMCHPKVVVPEHVVILGLGPSVDEYTNIVKRAGHRKAFADETWTINMLGNVFDSDLCFHMDDVRIQEIRAKARPDSNIANMLAWLKESKIPVMTSRSHPDYPMLVDFPLEDVLNNLKYDYFNSTAAYAVAYAIHIGVKKISLFGCDYTYPNAHDAEKGRACVEFWLGMATERGIKLSVPKKTTLLDALHSQAERFYGYDTLSLTLSQEDDKIRVEFAEVEKLPTAEEIEQRYDHSAHPNQIVEDTIGE